MCVCASALTHMHAHASMARGLSYVPYSFPSCEQEEDGLKPIGLGAVAEQRGGLVVACFGSVLSGPKVLWFRARVRSLPRAHGLLWLRPLDPTYRLNWPESNPDPGLEESH